MKTIPCKFPDELAEKVRVVAALQDISVSELIRRSVLNYLKDIDLDQSIDETKKDISNAFGSD